jgi:hypothetical protein
MLLDQGEHNLLVGFECLDGCRFILTHEPTISGHISTKDGGQLTLEILRVQGITP